MVFPRNSNRAGKYDFLLKEVAMIKPRRHIVLMTLSLAIFSVAFLSAQALPAGLENELVVRSEADETTANGLKTLFEKKYPGTKVIMASAMPSAQSYMKSFSELPSPQADILTTKTYYFIRGIKDARKKHNIDMFMGYKSPQRARLIPALMDKDGFWYVERWDARTIVYWADAAEKYGDVNSLQDLLTWKGSFEYADPIKTGSGFSFLQTVIQDFGPKKNAPDADRWMSGYLNPQGGIDFIAKLEKARKMAHPGTSTMVQLFSRKEIDAHWNFENYYHRYKLGRGYKVKACYPKEGTIISTNSVGILNNCRHPNAAKAWIDFVLSKETQEWITKNTYYKTAGKDVKLPEDMLGNAVPHPERINLDIPEELIAEKTKQYKEMWNSAVLK
jgi:iron(III) transport system substrate-binding protein